MPVTVGIHSNNQMVQPTTISVLGVAISRLGFEEALEACARRLDRGEGGYVCFANVHSVTESTTSSDLRAALNEAALSVADGMPLVWVSKMRGEPIRSRVCGPDFMTAFLERHSDITHGFLGGARGRAEALATRFKVESICYSPPMRPFSPENVLEDWKAFVKLSQGNTPHVVWVGLGAPKQELWMREASKLAPSTLFFGVGAAFDFLTGHKSRAPLWMQKSGLEWAFRLGQEPGRLWKRYAVTNSKFIVKELCEIFRREERSGNGPT